SRSVFSVFSVVPRPGVWCAPVRAILHPNLFHEGSLTTTRSWIRKRFARTPRRVRNHVGGYRPRLEALEERWAPAGPSTPTPLASLPVDAQAVVSATLGRDDTTYAVSPAGDGLRRPRDGAVTHR